MGEPRRRSQGVERLPPVGNRHVDDSPGPEHPKVVADCADRILGVLDEVVGDHEIEAGVGLAGQGLAVIDDVDLDQSITGELGVVLPHLRHRDPVDIPDRCPHRDAEGPVEGADLDAVAR